MHRILLIVSFLSFLLIGVSADAQRVCKRGIPCGNTCIAVNRTCRVGPAKADTSAPRTPDSVAAKTATLLARPSLDSAVASVSPRPVAGAMTSDSGPATAGLAKGGQTRVWANTKSRVYHCPGSRYYGNSSAGEWMTEAAAMKAGYRGAYNKRCGG
jgi:hypothetical protein